MVREIVRDPMFLSQKSEPASREDLPVAQDLLDTLRANSERCVGLAANMIGVTKRIIAVSVGPVSRAMLNPRIVSNAEPYAAEEGCLSLEGTRPATRYRSIEVEYRDSAVILRRQRFSGFTAQIIQHEIDHCEGILI